MSYTKRILMVLGLISLLPISVFADTMTDKINMFVGEIKIIEHVDVKRVAVGNGALVKLKVLPNQQLLVIAENAGSTSLHLWFKDGRESDMNLRISEKDPQRRVHLEDMIKMDVKIVEFRKSALRSLGINWQSQIQGPSLAMTRDWSSNPYFRGTNSEGIFQGIPNQLPGYQTYFGIATSITSRINYLASNGDAFTLAEPNLSCINGGKADFLAGGEVPIPIRGPNGEVTIEYKKYGVLLNISPEADDNGVINAKVSTEVSQLDQSVNVMGAPGFLVRSTKTQMNLHDGETIVISGLLNSKSSKDVNKIPLLGDIPILGHLFKSTDFRNSQTELAIFVTPHVVSAKSKSNVMRLQDLNKRKDSRMKYLQDKLDFSLAD
jgi:pilus assembly protein CpaC